ncbi:sulfatase [Bacteroides sedimenti]|uniref:N-acetylgalactosamine-6-sulfatase n=1 Tax=Bacteroides sedimenti TaxID=2136147 RepID=A0ABM8IIJ7_9BACE
MNLKNLQLLTTGALIGGACLSSVSAQEKPNIIVFLVDDMGLMDTSVPFITDGQGNPVRQPLNNWYRTPNMERLASQGTRFSTFYAQSVSSPSRTSIMTGQNATRHRTTNWINSESNNRTPFGPPEWNWKGLNHADITYPKMLQKAGYRTIHVGKAHFGCMNSEGENPKNIGFDVNIAGSSIGQPGSYHGENGYGWIKGNKERAVPGLEKYHRTNTFLSDALTLEAGEEIAKAVAEKRPFYLNMAHYAVHAPFETDERFIGHYTAADKNDQAKAFATLIEGMDKSLGDLMEKLEKLGVAQNTLIIFLGDNGGDAPLGGAADYGSSAPLKGKKGSEFEGGVRVPFIVSWAHPDAKNKFQKQFPIAKNKVMKQIGTVMDIYPTVLSVSGIKAPKNHVLDGFSLKTLLQGKPDKNHPQEFLMHFPHEHRGSYFTTFRKGDWKLIYHYNPENPGSPGYQLYNLAKDETETTNLVKSEPEKLKAMVSEMTQRLKAEGALYPVDKDGKALEPIIPQ